MLHELLHASFGDPSQANYGLSFGLPYGVPIDLRAGEEEAYLASFNVCEARSGLPADCGASVLVLAVDESKLTFP